MVYALITFHWRAAAIRKRSGAPYDDRFGPVCSKFFTSPQVLTGGFRLSSASHYWVSHTTFDYSYRF